MTQDEIIEMARQVGIQDAYSNSPHKGVIAQLEAFAKLVAKHTLMNIDPSKFMSWQEGFEAGATKEREARRAYIYELERDLEVAQDKINEYLVADYQRARGQA